MTTWFDGGDVTRVLRGSSGDEGAIPPPSICDACARGAIQMVEQLTGFQPFLGTEVGSRAYDPPGMQAEGYLLNLRTGFLTLDSVTVSGAALVVGTDVWGLPPDAVSRGHAYTWLRFARALGGPPQSIIVTGIIGAATAVPADLYNAALDYAAQLAREAVAPTAALARVRQGSVEFAYRDDGGPTEAARRQLAAVCRRYQRV